MKMMVEHHFAGIPKVFCFYFFVQLFKIYMKLFQNIVIPGYIEGLDYNSHIPTCTSVGPLLRKIIQQHVFFKHIPKPGWYPRVFLEGMEYPRYTCEGDHVG